jgi:gluconokinase
VLSIDNSGAVLHKFGEAAEATLIIVLMGVTGTGKTTVGHALAQATGWTFADADDFHPERNRAKMASGIPLDDDDRAPWLEALHSQILQWIQSGQSAILACSALKQSYRDVLSRSLAQSDVRFVWLDGPEALIHQRMEARPGHYMPPSLLPSQIATLEPPVDAIRISIRESVPEIVQEILDALKISSGLGAPPNPSFGLGGM